MKRLHTVQKALSMVELILVIVILGIVSSIASQVIVHIYEGYVIQKSVHTASLKTQLAIDILANRLGYRMDQSVLARRVPQTNDPHLTLSNNDAYALQDLPYDQTNNYQILEWIGYDNDGFSAYKTPLWSGFVDLNQSTYHTLHTTGSNLNHQSSMAYYTNRQYEGAAIRFVGESQYREDGGSYHTKCMYRSDGCIFPITLTSNPQTFDFHSPTSNDGNRTQGKMIYSEFYLLSTSAFAIVPENMRILSIDQEDITLYDLRLYYAYQPWEDENYTQGKNALLLKNVSVFRFKQETHALRLKLCVQEPIGQNQYISICKEKAVIR